MCNDSQFSEWRDEGTFLEQLFHQNMGMCEYWVSINIHDHYYKTFIT